MDATSTIGGAVPENLGKAMGPGRGTLTGANGRPVSVADDKPSMTVIARKIALAFYLASREEKAVLIEDAGDVGLTKP